MSAPVRFGIIGAGGIAEGHSQSLASLDGAELCAVADVDLDAARRIAGDHEGAKAFGGHSELLTGEDLDAVVVCTPPSTHAAIIHEALDSGVAVLSEKPFTIDVNSARRLFQRSLDADTMLTMASKFRFVDDVHGARRLIRGGAIGEPVIFENAFTSHVDMSQRWNANPAISGGGVIIDNGTHSADIVRYLIGPVTEVMAIEGKRVQHLAVEDTAKMFLRTSGGVMASIDLSWSLDKSLEHFIWVYGTEGEIRIGWRESSIRVHRGSGDWETFGTGYAKISCMQAQLRNLCGALRGEEELVITAEDALSSVGVIEAAYRSLPRSEWRQVNTRIAADAMSARVHPTAIVEEGVELGDRTAVWDNAHLRGPSRIGADCIIGEKTYIAYDVVIGDRCKLNAMVYVPTAVTIEDGVMISAGTTFTNDRYPRACTSDLEALRQSDADEHTVATLVREGSTIGAGATIGPGITLGRFSMIGMGSVVTSSVGDFHLVVGNPARVVGAVARGGPPLCRAVEGMLPEGDHTDDEGYRYRITGNVVTELGRS